MADDYNLVYDNPYWWQGPAATPGSGGGYYDPTNPYGYADDYSPNGAGGLYWDPATGRWQYPPPNGQAGIWQGNQYYTWDPYMGQYIANPNAAPIGGQIPGGQGGSSGGGDPWSGLQLQTGPGGQVIITDARGNPVATSPWKNANGAPQPGQTQFVYNNTLFRWDATKGQYVPEASQQQQQQTYSPQTSDPYSQPASPQSRTGGVGDWFKKYGNYVYAGLGFMNDYFANKAAQENAKKAQKAMERQRTETLSFASPAAYQGAITGEKGMYPFYAEMYKPAFKTQAEAISLATQGNLQAYETDAARHGNLGAGVYQVGRNGIRAAGEAAYGDAVRKYQEAIFGKADEAGQRIYAGQINASVGAPYSFIPNGPSTGQTATSAATAGLGNYMLGKALDEYPYQMPAEYQRYYQPR